MNFTLSGYHTGSPSKFNLTEICARRRKYFTPTPRPPHAVDLGKGVSYLHSAELERLEWNVAIRGRSFHSNLFSGVCVHSNYKKEKLE